MIETQVLTQAVIDLFSAAFPVAGTFAICAALANFAICFIVGKDRVKY